MRHLGGNRLIFRWLVKPDTRGALGSELKRAGGRAASPQLAPPSGGTFLGFPMAGLRPFEAFLGVLQTITGTVGLQDMNPVG